MELSPVEKTRLRIAHAKLCDLEKHLGDCRQTDTTLFLTVLGAHLDVLVALKALDFLLSPKRQYYTRTTPP